MRLKGNIDMDTVNNLQEACIIMQVIALIGFIAFVSALFK